MCGGNSAHGRRSITGIHISSVASSSNGYRMVHDVSLGKSYSCQFSFSPLAREAVSGGGLCDRLAMLGL